MKYRFNDCVVCTMVSNVIPPLAVGPTGFIAFAEVRAPDSQSPDDDSFWAGVEAHRVKGWEV